MERQLLGETFVPRRSRRKMKQHGRVARRIAQDLQHRIGGQFRKTRFGGFADTVVGVATQMEIESGEDRARQRERSARRCGADGERSGAGQDAL
jgi:hypothetical protein